MLFRSISHFVDIPHNLTIVPEQKSIRLTIFSPPELFQSSSCTFVTYRSLLSLIFLDLRFSIPGVIEWPPEDEAPPEDARDLVTKLLEQDPIARLGTTG